MNPTRRSTSRDANIGRKIRRLLRRYRRWDEAVYQRVMLSRRLTVIILVMINVITAGMVLMMCSVVPGVGVMHRTFMLSIAATFIGFTNVLGFYRFRQQLNEQRAKARCCLHCGYDLRESVGRCPECGVKF